MSEQGTRPTTRYMKSYFKGAPVIGAEIGVFKGINALRMLKILDMAPLHCIDSWITPECMKGELDYNALYFETVKRLKERSDVEIHRATSHDIASKFKREYFDFVYIDGDHGYEGCKQDIEDYYPLVKKGGILCGHDFRCEGVRKAVTQFSKKHNLTVLDTRAIGEHDRRPYGEWLIKV